MRKILFLLVIFIFILSFLGGEELTLEKLYSDAPMIGVPPRVVLWSPDESRCAFMWNEDSGRIRNLYCYETDSGLKPQKLTAFDKQGISGFCWGRKSNEIIYLRGTSIFLFDINDLSAKEIHKSKKRMRALALSPDGSFLCYLQDGNIWMYDFEAEIGSQVTHFDAKNERISRYSWSPDSQRIAFFYQDYTGIRQVDIPRFDREKVSLQKVPRPFPGDPDNTRKIGVLDIPQKNDRFFRETPQKLEKLTCMNDQVIEKTWWAIQDLNL